MHFKYSCSKFQDIGVLLYVQIIICPESKVHGANMGPTSVLSAPCGPHKPCRQGVFYICHSCAVHSNIMWWNTYSNEIPLYCCYSILNRYTAESMYSVLVKCKNIHFSHNSFSAVLSPLSEIIAIWGIARFFEYLFTHMWYYWLFQ